MRHVQPIALILCLAASFGPAARAAMALLALQNQRRPEEHIEVTFDDRPAGAPEPASTPQTPDQVAPPAPVPEPRAEPDPRSAGERAERRG